MKAHTSEFKETIPLLGREIDAKISYLSGGVLVELGKEDLNSITPNYEGSILKSVMKNLDIDSNVDIPVNTILNFQFGVLIEDEYEYLNYGNYVVYSSEKQEDTRSYKIKCYDKMLYSMVDYETMNLTYPITIRSYISAICLKLGLVFKNASDEFVNYNRTIKKELYLDSDGNSLGYKFRDVLDELAQATASTICINELTDELEIRYINDTNDTIDESYLKDINVTFGKKYGPVNSIVLSRAAESDNVYLRDEESVTLNGLCELKIKDNQIMNDNDRSDYLPGLLGELDGLEYYLNDFSSTGIMYYELCDRYNIQVDENTYSCIMFNDEANITQGLEEFIHTDLPQESETDYSKADKTDRKLNQTYIMVNKQEGEIQALARKIVDVSKTTSGTDEVTLENAYEGSIHQLKIVGDLSLVFPNDSSKYGFSQIISEDLIVSQDTLISSGVPYQNDTLYPSSEIYPKTYKIVVDDEDEYKIDLNYLNYINAEVHDEWVYEEGKQYIIRRVGINSSGEKYALDDEVVENLKDIELIMIKSNSNIKLIANDNSILSATYLLQNDFTSTFTTKYEVTAEINIKANEIEQKVSGVADGEGNVTAASIILAINNDESSAVINADKIVLEGNDVINAIAGNEINLTSKNINITSDHFSVDEDGNVTASSMDITGGTIDITTQSGNITVGKGTGLIEMSGAYQSNNFHAMYNVGGMYYQMNNNYRFRVAAASDSPYIALYNSSGYETINAQTLNSAGYMYLNNSSGSTTIDLTGSTGTIQCVRVIQTSKEEMKKDFEKLENALDIINNTDIYKYHFKDENEEDQKHIGFVIGEKYKYPIEATEKNEGVDVYSFVSICCQAIKEQQKQIDELKERIEKLERNDKQWL